MLVGTRPARIRQQLNSGRNGHVATELYDAIVIGSGQGGDPLARAFAGAGKKTALIERAAVGGTCINYGCTPTKTMAHIAKVAQTVRRSAEYGVLTSPPKIDMLRVRELKRGIVEEFRSATEKHIQKIKNLDLVLGHATFTGPKSVAIRDSGRTLKAGVIVINTGTRPHIPEIDGLDAVPCLTNRTIMELDHVPESLIVLGGGYIGLEFGQMFSRFGSKVTIIEQGPRLLAREDKDVSDAVREILEGEGIEIIVGASVRRASGQVLLTLDTPEGERRVRGSELLVAVGRRPNTHDLGATQAGIELDDRGFIKSDNRLKTSADGVYVIGDVKGGPAFTHISYDDYRVLKANLIDGEDRTISGRLVPQCTFIDPQLGRIGFNETEAKNQGVKYRLCKMPMSDVARAEEMNEKQGLIKALVSKETDRILGAAVLGVDGGEIMSMIELAMLGGLTAKQLNDAIFAHPTLSELLNNLFA